jgi:hypothetical protein
MSDMDELARAAQAARVSRGMAAQSDLCDYCRNLIDVQQPQYRVSGRVTCARCYAHFAQAAQVVDVPGPLPPQPQPPPQYPPAPYYPPPQAYASPQQTVYVIQQAPQQQQQRPRMNALIAVGTACTIFGLLLLLSPLGWLLLVVGFILLVAGMMTATP